VIGVEKLSLFLDPTDRSTAFIFADGAGAVVVGAADEVPRVVPTAQFAGADAHDAPTREAIAEAARRAVEPLADLAGGVEYKRHLVGVFTQRAIDALVTQAT